MALAEASCESQQHFAHNAPGPAMASRPADAAAQSAAHFKVLTAPGQRCDEDVLEMMHCEQQRIHEASDCSRRTG